jgi:hypothetical protein
MWDLRAKAEYKEIENRTVVSRGGRKLQQENVGQSI